LNEDDLFEFCVLPDGGFYSTIINQQLASAERLLPVTSVHFTLHPIDIRPAFLQ
jgi:hypothetical protein